MTKKVFVLDTNVLINDPRAVNKFSDHVCIVPMIVLEELDNHKSKERTGYPAREAIRALLRLINGANAGDIISLKDGGQLILDHEPRDANLIKKYKSLDLGKPDNRIIMVGLRYKHDPKYANRVTIVTNDGTVRAKAHAYRLASEEYRADNYTDDLERLYKEPTVIDVDPEQSTDFYSRGVVVKGDSLPGEAVFVRLDDDSKLLPAVFFDRRLHYLPDDEMKKQHYFTPRNLGQDLAFRLAMDDRIKVLILTGGAGTGKTLEALAIGMHAQMHRKGIIRIVRPTDQAAEGLGFLPGTLDEKMGPYKEAIESNYDVIAESLKKHKLKAEPFDVLCHADGKIRIKPINFDLGVTYRGFVICDEVQNLTVPQAKLFLTRIGGNTKVILTGDIGQIAESTYLTKRSSGLTHIISQMGHLPFVSHVHLTEGERSEVATAASQFL